MLVMGLALAASAAAQSLHPVEIAAIEGLPPDSLQRNPFLAGFQSAFERARLDREISGIAGWSAALSIANAFQLRRPGADRDAWSVRVRVVLPPIAGGTRTVMTSDPSGRSTMLEKKGWANPKRRLTRSMVVRVSTFTANEARLGVGLDPDEVSVQLPGPPPTGEGTPVYPLHGYDFPWRDAGRIAGLLALESLHHRSHDLGARERLVLPSWIRLERQD